MLLNVQGVTVGNSQKSAFYSTLCPTCICRVAVFSNIIILPASVPGQPHRTDSVHKRVPKTGVLQVFFVIV